MRMPLLVIGGTGKPEGLETGYFVKPTIFADVNNQMTIAQTEIFGPVLSMIPFDTKKRQLKLQMIHLMVLKIMFKLKIKKKQKESQKNYFLEL